MELDFVSILMLMRPKIKSRRRKIYYVPGFISLLFLPIFLFTIPPLNKDFTVITYLTPNDVKDNYGLVTFSGQYFLKKIRKKKIIPFYFNEDHEANKKKLTIIESEALKLKFTCDTNHVIAVHLSDDIYYGEFISLLNLMLKNNFKRYGEWKNIFYILGEEPPCPDNEIKLIY